MEWPPAEDAEEEEDGDENQDGEWQGYDGYGEADEVGQVFPTPAGQWPGARGSGSGVDRDEAIGYALHAQYWAGYWMGIAHASGAGADEAAASRADADGYNGAANDANHARGGTRPRGNGRASNGLRR